MTGFFWVLGFGFWVPFGTASVRSEKSDEVNSLFERHFAFFAKCASSVHADFLLCAEGGSVTLGVLSS